ncbi:MAG: toxin-antitoxin system HicB family antitoxin [Acetobacteraceae bacterium]
MSKATSERTARGRKKGAGEPEYRFTVRPLAAEEGGGFLIEYPELPGCMSDGETIEEALANGRDAMADWIAAMREAGRAVPAPGSDASEGYSGRWVLRTPKSLHRHLAEQAKREGVSLNTLAVTLLAEGIGERLARKHGTAERAAVAGRGPWQ